MQSIKEHNLKANHKQKVNASDVLKICMQSIKEHNLKANHNSFINLPPDLNLYAIYQRTQSESKSQLLGHV
ncbi:MAG: hypothetical protein KF775_19135 [Cyclobacteriaceae bacterium]|nr:hypothetical protein [Cyclobacteriaceae bacterium]